MIIIIIITDLGEIYHAIFKPLHFGTFWVPDPKNNFTNRLGMQSLVIKKYIPNCCHVQADDQFNSNGVQTRPTTFSHVQAGDQFNSNGVQTRPTITFGHVQQMTSLILMVFKPGLLSHSVMCKQMTSLILIVFKPGLPSHSVMFKQMTSLILMVFKPGLPSH